MGNSNSTSGGQQNLRPNHHRYPQGYDYNYDHHNGWSHSLEAPDQRNRMKRGYFPPRAYVGVGPGGHPGSGLIPQPQKVLPQAVNPNKLLKATSNGAILHGGGTISGRKLSEIELDMRKRSTASCPANNNGDDHFNGLSSGRSTPNLLMPRMGLSAGGSCSNSKGSGRSRDYGSEPDLRDVGLKPGSNNIKHEDYDLDPERSVSPLPNSFTLISESPAKKQIRSRKKSKAPPPPQQGHMLDPMSMNMNMMNLIPYQYQLQQNPQRQLLLTPVLSHDEMSLMSNGKKKLRLFKTKAESKSALSSPAIRSPSGSELLINTSNSAQFNSNNVSRGGPRASLDPNKIMRGDRERISVHSVEGNLQTLQNIQNLQSQNKNTSSHPIDRESKVGGKDSRNPRLKPGPLCSPNPNSSRNENSNKMSSHAQTPTSATRDASSGFNLNFNKVPKASSANLSKSNQIEGEKITTNNEDKKTFYFGMDMGLGTFKQKSTKNQEEAKTSNFLQQNSKISGQNESQSHSADLHKEISRRKMLQKLDNEFSNGSKSPSPRNYEDNNANKNHANPGNTVPLGQSRSDSRNSTQQTTPPKYGNELQLQLQKSQVSQLNGRGKNTPSPVTSPIPANAKNSKPLLHKVNSNNINRSESDSDGIHRRQDSGSFDINDNQNDKMRKGRNAPNPKVANNKASGVIRESSSDLSSSDLDVPLVVRPTLPQKRPDLPRFSPTAAWRAIDSPSRTSNISGRSFDIDSSEEGKLHRYTRPSAPPRISHERSGDSGISAGDAGSPANPLPLMEENMNLANDADLSSSPVMINRNGKNRNNVGRNLKNSKDMLSADRMMKCWTPEQDLDESSSDFEHDHDPILPPVPPKPVSGKSSKNKIIVPVPPKCNLFEGKRAAAVVSDSDSKYYGGSAMSDEFSSGGRRFHGRSTKAKQFGGGDGNPSKKRFNYPQNQNNNQKYQNNGKYSSNIRTPFNKAIHHSPNGFVGLDTNWFLSRSEPNSLNYVGMSDFSHNNIHNYNYTEEFRRIPPPPLKKKLHPNPKNQSQSQYNGSKEVIVGSRRRMPKNDQDDELECELQLGDEEESGSSDNLNNTRNNNSGGGRLRNKAENKSRRSEIGYGPSSMNFLANNSSSYEDQEEEIEFKGETNESSNSNDEIEEELMRDDLFDYLDQYQYEEGEFEREQELTSDNLLKDGSKDKNDGTNHNRPFSHHIMYLPSYDTRKVCQKNAAHQNWRRARSVDHLDSSEVTLFKRANQSPNRGRNERYLDVEIESEGNQHHHQQLKSNGVFGHKSRQGTKPIDRKSSVPSYFPQEVQPTSKKLSSSTTNANSEVKQNHNQMTPEEEERRAQNKKKFKFQSTLRVNERRKIEQELTREAEQREEERLREMEAMKKVEAEFQKKRAREKMEKEAASANMNGIHGKDELSNFKITSASSRPVVGPTKININTSNTNINKSGRPFHPQSSGPSSPRNSANSTPNGVNIRVNGRQQYHMDNSGDNLKMMSQRQEPEGAPASVSVNSVCNSNSSSSTTTDLRRELITASKKRSGNMSGLKGSNQELGHTQELSEYRQETRQYCDYRRAPRQQSLSPARFVQKSSSSDIFPIPSRRKAGSSYSGGSKASGRSTVHPEVVCDIPNKPTPYLVNASRLGGSHMNLMPEERPNSVLGSASPSVISDNYRKDWAHRDKFYRGSSVLQGGRASSVISLNSAPGYSSSDNFRNSTSDLSRTHLNHNYNPNGNMSPHFLRDRSRANRLARQYSTSPPPSSSPVPCSNESTATDSIHQMSEKSSSNRASPIRISNSRVSNTTVISIGPQLPHSKPKGANVFQPQPYNNKKVKGYRPVQFKPPAPTTTAVN